MKTSNAKKLCFSYIRYSSGKQHGNSSEARQLDIAPRVAAEKGWTLDESLMGGVRDISKPYAKARFKLIYDPIKGVLFVDPRTKVRTLQPSDFFTD